MARRIRILCVHGLGDHRARNWQAEWRDAVRRAFPAPTTAGAVELDFVFLTYDDIFQRVELSFFDTARALGKLSSSAIGGLFRRQRGAARAMPDVVHWTAGYVVAWLEDEAFKTATRRRMLSALRQHQPDVVLAHSLGSLITYDSFAHRDAQAPAVAAALRRTRYVTLGSQLGNAFVTGNLTGGRIQPLRVASWHHLYNRHDDVFTAPIQLWDMPRFRQVDTPFDVDGVTDHDAPEYLVHRQTIAALWQPLATPAARTRALGAATPRRQRVGAGTRVRRSATKRALLVGINRYPNEADCLEGCVNDVFLMSSTLQECGFPADSIRVCLDERATAAGIKERLQWLLDDPQPGDERVFYYSGHGARLPEYGRDFEPDRKVETLVPHDFAWTIESGVTDDEIHALYAQLPYAMRFAMILDCCHSGGMHRQGGARVRGINPPDDIRHRELRWDSAQDMWVARDFQPLNRGFARRDDERARYFGSDGVTTRLGRATLVRQQTEAEYERAKRASGDAPIGPYLPLVIEACNEAQFSYEYRHGVTSYGAFTYALCLELRRRKRISFERLVDVARAKLSELGYEQTPQILGPSAVRRARVPWTS